MSFKRDSAHLKQEKFRSLLCQCSLMTGNCPYEDGCLFLHDPRVFVDSKPPLIGISGCKQKAPPLNTTRDAFYWPDQSHVNAVGQRYEIPEKFARSFPHGNSLPSAHNRGIFSLWSHFTQMLLDRSSGATSSFQNSFLPDRSRLPIFVRLAQGEHLDIDEFRSEKKAHIPTFFEWKALHSSSSTIIKKGVTLPRGCSARGRESC
jgi:hypothetical protein